MRSLKKMTVFDSSDVHKLLLFLFLLKMSGVGRILGGLLVECFGYRGSLVF